MTDDWRNGGFGIYIHWPFCQSKCPYCDFNSHVTANIDQSRWRDAYLRELDRYAALVPERVVGSVFFGGGTPSLMEPQVVDAILDRIRKNWPQANDVEVTLEANPGSVEASRFSGYADAGVNRISMGIQALNDRDLTRLGRLHSVDEALAAFDIARRRFDRVSFDLIYARQDQTLSDWQAELTRALSLAVDHLSLYQLTIEEGTAFGDRFRRGGLRGLPDADRAADMYQATQEIAGAHGFNAYEVSNHALSGAESRHNTLYWRYGDYVGIGPGAHGRVTLGGQRHATEQHSQPGKWLAAAESGTADNEMARLTGREQAEEYLLMGLRLRDGISSERFANLNGAPVDRMRLEELADLAMIVQDGDALRATAEGRMVLNAVLERLLG